MLLLLLLLSCRTRVDPNYVKNEKGDFEIAISTTAMDGDRECVGVPAWRAEAEWDTHGQSQLGAACLEVDGACAPPPPDPPDPPASLCTPRAARHSTNSA